MIYGQVLAYRTKLEMALHNFGDDVVPMDITLVTIDKDTTRWNVYVDIDQGDVTVKEEAHIEKSIRATLALNGHPESSIDIYFTGEP